MKSFLILLSITLFILPGCDQKSQKAMAKKVNQVNVAKKNVGALNLQMKSQKQKIPPVDPK